MKLNWGFGILIFILLFIAFILTLVYKCSQQKVELVSEKYYELELAYQQKINAMNNASLLPEKLNIQYNKENDAVEISYPKNVDRDKPSGVINFFKPEDAKLDFSIGVKCGNANEQIIPVPKIHKGWWKVNVSWVSAGTSYSHEEKILIN